MLDTEKTTMLDQPLDMTQIKHRRGAGNRQLAYISGKFAMDQANRIFGYGRWGYKVVSRGHMVIDDPKKGKVDMYTADVELWVAGADFTFPGAGVGIVTEPCTVETHEKAYKEAETDAMKRALRHYGDQFGLCLYDGDDYVDAGNGEMIQVKDVPIQGRQALAKRIVDAQPQQQISRQLPAPAVTNEAPVTPLPTFKQMYSTGKEKGLWADSAGFYKFGSDVLKIAVDGGVTLSREQRVQLAQAIDSAEPLAQAS